MAAARGYCDDIGCPNFIGDECKLGFILIFRTPKSHKDIQNCDWGYVMPKICQAKFRKQKIKELEESKSEA